MSARRFTGSMRTAPANQLATPLLTAFDLYDREVKLKWTMLKRKFPKASKKEIDKKVDRWLRTPPPLHEGTGFIKVPRSQWPKAWRTKPNKPEKGESGR